MGGGATLGENVGEIIGDGAKELGMNDTIHAHLIWGVGHDVIKEDMVLQRELSNSFKELLVPLAVEGGCDIKKQWHEGSDVLYHDGLGVQVLKGHGLLLKKCHVEMRKIAIGFSGSVIVTVRFLGMRLHYRDHVVDGITKTGISRDRPSPCGQG